MNHGVSSANTASAPVRPNEARSSKATSTLASTMKHGWHWVRDTEGYFWGAKRRDGILHTLLQVEDKPPSFPTVEWTRQSLPILAWIVPTPSSKLTVLV